MRLINTRNPNFYDNLHLREIYILGKYSLWWGQIIGKVLCILPRKRKGEGCVSSLSFSCNHIYLLGGPRLQVSWLGLMILHWFSATLRGRELSVSYNGIGGQFLGLENLLIPPS